MPLPIPAPDPLLLPMPPSVLNVFLLATFTLHLMAMNPYLDRMPPFAGTEKEAELVGKYLSTLKNQP